MSSGLVRWALVHLNDWTWFVAEYRVWLIALATVIGGVAPLLSAARKRQPGTALSRVIRSAAMALALSAAVVAICSLLHFSDLRWLPPNQRGSLHVSAPGGFLGFTKPTVTVINSVAGLPAEWRAAQVSVHTAIVCAFLAVAGLVLMVGTWRRARHADIRQIVQEEIRKATVVSRLCGTGNNRLPVVDVSIRGLALQSHLPIFWCPRRGCGTTSFSSVALGLTNIADHHDSLRYGGPNDARPRRNDCHIYRHVDHLQIIT